VTLTRRQKSVLAKLTGEMLREGGLLFLVFGAILERKQGDQPVWLMVAEALLSVAAGVIIEVVRDPEEKP
jgi:hypothetical protein